MDKLILEARERFLELLGQTGVISQSAIAAGLSMSTIRRWRNEDEEFRTACSDAMALIVGEAEAVMVRIMRDREHRDNYKAAEFLLKSHERVTYGANGKIQLQLLPGRTLQLPTSRQPFGFEELPEPTEAEEAVEAAFKALEEGSDG